MRSLLLLALLRLCASGAYGAGPATMTLESGKVVDLDKMYRESQGKCCRSVYDVGLGSENTIMRMDNSGGKYYVTNDPNCGNVIYSSSYSTTFSYIYLCGQCKGGCPQVDGGKSIVPRGGICTKQDGSTDVYLVCENSAPICHVQYQGQPGKCSTYADIQANPAPCRQWAPTGKPCDTPRGQCCESGKCEGNTCAAGAPPPPPACVQFANLGAWCGGNTCCAGGPKNAKCENSKCVSTYPPAPAPAPVPVPGPVACVSYASLGSWCGGSTCCGGAPKNAKCENSKCVSTYPTAPTSGVTPAQATATSSATATSNSGAPDVASSSATATASGR